MLSQGAGGCGLPAFAQAAYAPVRMLVDVVVVVFAIGAVELDLLCFKERSSRLPLPGDRRTSLAWRL